MPREADKDFAADSGSSILGQSWSFPLHLHPGHCLLVSSLPICYSAYRAYHRPLDDVLRPVLQTHKVSMQSIDSAEDSVRRAMASAVAGRALKVSSLASVGGFGLLGALAFYGFGWTSTADAVNHVRDWAHQTRKEVDYLLGVNDRMDRDHPEVTKMERMSYDEQLECISKACLPEDERKDL